MNMNQENLDPSLNMNHETLDPAMNMNHETLDPAMNMNHETLDPTMSMNQETLLAMSEDINLTGPDVSPASLDITASGGAAGIVLTETMPAPRCQAPSRSRRILAMDSSGVIPARRSSTRSIKRKKFDDELVESSLVKTERGRIKTSCIVTAASTSAIVHPGHSVQAHSQSPGPFNSTSVGFGSCSGSDVATVDVGKPGTSYLSLTPVTTMTIASAPGQGVGMKSVKEDIKETARPGDGSLPACPSPEKRNKPSAGKVVHSPKVSGGKVVSGGTNLSKTVSSKSALTKSTSHSKSRSRSRRARRQKTASPAVKDLGRWKPHDDLALITAVQQTNDLSIVHAGVKFSCRFTLKEIEDRWYALLYDPSVSKMAMEAARQLHSDTVATIQGKALYSCTEEKLLGTFASTSQPTLENFQSLLAQYPEVFHPARTAKTLHSHWLLMKQYHLLPDQTVQPMPRGDHILNLSDIEDFLNDEDKLEGTDETAEKELALVDRRNKREIRHLEQEMPKWQVLVDSVTGISMPDFDSQTLAVLRGRLVRYLMRSREISLGRSTKDNHVDVDLSLEGPSWKISRRQGIIKLRNSGDFFIANEGKRPILVDGRPVMAGGKQKLSNNSVVEISCLRFTFLINMEVINIIRADASKTINSVGTL